MEAMTRRNRWSPTALLVVLAGVQACASPSSPDEQVSSPETARTFAVRNLPGFATTTFLPNDDGTYPANGPGSGTPAGTPIPQPLGFTVNYYGLNFSTAYVNNNGSITFDLPLSTFTPFDLTSTATQIIAPFFADVDTRSAGSLVTFGNDVVDGHTAFGVNWIDVDYYYSDPTHTNRNSFQLVLIDRSDVGPYDFDIEFNYDQVRWEAGTASGGDTNGLGGYSARAGYSNGTRVAGTFFELAGSAVNGAFLDSNVATGLIYNMLNSTQPGRYVFQVRNGVVQITTLALSPAEATATVGQTHVVTATVATNGSPVAGETVSFTVTGANSVSGTCVSASDGTCSFAYPGMNPGDDLIAGSVNVSENDVTASATAHWDAAAPTGQCPLSHGFWKNHRAAWPATSLTLGTQTYDQSELLALLKSPTKGDASLILARQLIAARLNIANGSDPAPIIATLVDADALLSLDGKLPYDVKPSSSAGQAMTLHGKSLDSYNTGSMTPNCVP
jgi:hypothetical protein